MSRWTIPCWWAYSSTSATRMPMARAGKPEEVANAILWLLSEEASYITGATLPVAGGR